MMKRRWLAVALVAVMILIGVRFAGEQAKLRVSDEGLEKQEGRALMERGVLQAKSVLPPGDEILRGYGKPDGTVQRDLRLMAEVLGNFALLMKGDEPLPLGANEELAMALQGKNRGNMKFLSEDSAVLNDLGQLVDRWGTALFFHARDRRRVDIRSAGPDGEMWTEDDVHRLHDGRFLRGERLNAPSLFEASDFAGESR